MTEEVRGSADPYGIAKAIRDTGIPAAIEAAKELLIALVGPASEEAGLLLQDRVREHRIRNQLATLSRVGELVAEAGLRPGRIPLRTLAPLLDGCSQEEDPDLREMWAALIANASVDPAAVPPSFPHIMSRLSPGDAQSFQRAFTRQGWPVGAWVVGNFRRWSGRRSTDAKRAWEEDIVVANLESLGLVSEEATESWVRSVIRGDDERGDPFTRRPNTIERPRGRPIVLTGLGEAFLLAVRPPLARPVRVDTEGMEGDYDRLMELLGALEAAGTAAYARGDLVLRDELASEAHRIRSMVETKGDPEHGLGMDPPKRP